MQFFSFIVALPAIIAYVSAAPADAAAGLEVRGEVSGDHFAQQ